MTQHYPVGCGLIFQASRSHSDTPRAVELLWASDQPEADNPDNTQHSHETDVHALGGNRTLNPTKRTTADPSLKPRSYIVYYTLHTYSYLIKELIASLTGTLLLNSSFHTVYA
jgi:hypothetical protein